MREQRRLAAIVAVDVVGYSRLMSRDESGTMARLREHRQDRLGPIATRHGGRLVKLMGDGAMLEFSSAVDALSAAIDLQQAMADANSDIAEDQAIVFRIGLHLGDVIVEGEDLYGDGVNIAARLEAAAAPGGVLVSGAVHDATVGRLEAAFEDRGWLALKNIERQVQAYAVRWDADDWKSRSPAPVGARAPGDRPSIAILPLLNMSGDPSQEYFADGVSEDIVGALSRFHELVVIARGSSFAFKGKGLELGHIAARLGVRYLLNGSLRKAGNRVRVSVELIEAASGAQIWSDRYDRDLADVFALQDEISQTVAAVIVPAIRGAEIERARRTPPASLSGYDLYLRALPHLWTGTRADVPKAIDLLRQSLAHEPGRATTLAALAMALMLAPPAGVPISPEMPAEAVALARRAVEQDATDSFAQAVCGYTLFGPAGDYAQAILHAQEAVRLNPNSAFAWGTLGYIHSLGGSFAPALEELQQALRLSPYDSFLSHWLSALAAACFGLGRHEEGSTWARKAVRQNPGNGTAHWLLAANLAAAGRLDEAREVTAKRDAVQKTTLRELRALRLFKPEAALERYLAIQREIGVPE